MRLQFLILLLASLGLVACSHGASQSSSEVVATGTSSGSVNITLTNKASGGGVKPASLSEVEHIYVNVKRVELVLSSKRFVGRLALSENLGRIDLETLSSGLDLPLASVHLRDGVKTHQVRLILEDSGHEVVFRDGRKCLLETPSAQKSGIKILNPDGVSMASGDTLNLNMDVDVEQSLHIGNDGTCKLVPVIKGDCKHKRHEDDIDANCDCDKNDDSAERDNENDDDCEMDADHHSEGEHHHSDKTKKEHSNGHHEGERDDGMCTGGGVTPDPTPVPTPDPTPAPTPVPDPGTYIDPDLIPIVTDPTVF